MGAGPQQVKQIFGPRAVPQCAVAPQVSGRDGARPQQACFQQVGLASAGLNSRQPDGARFPHATPLLTSGKNVHKRVAHVGAVEWLGGPVQLRQEDLPGIAPRSGHGG